MTRGNRGTEREQIRKKNGEMCKKNNKIRKRDVNS